MKTRFIIALVLCFSVFICAIPVSASVAEVPVPHQIVGDVDNDGEVSITDCTKIQRWLAEMPVDAPIGEPEINDYTPIELNFIPVLEREEAGDDPYVIYSTEELTDEILCNRMESGVLVFERVIAQITDERPDIRDGADGVILGTNDPITYRFLDYPVYEGTIMLTYLCYSPLTNAPDDVYNRYDFILDRRYEVKN